MLRTGRTRREASRRRRLAGGLFAGVVVATAALPAAPAYSATFTNAAPIAIADGSGSVPPFTPGLATPYPSTIGVSGLAGTVSRVTVTLDGINHANPDDLDVMLVGPSGQKVVLLSDAGESSAITSLTLTVDDAAPANAPDLTALTGPSYRPTDHFGGLGEDVTNEFPPPAPVKPGTAASQPLSTFNGTGPNGVWALYATDDNPGATGNIGGGWALDITTQSLPPVIPPVTTPASPPVPVLGKAVAVAPVRGEVFISLPVSRARAAQTVPGIKGRRFIPLSQARQIPVGSLLDTRRGTVRVTSARNTRGATQSGDFSRGVFEVRQSSRRRARGFTELRLKGGVLRRCGRSRGALAARGGRRRIRRGRGRATGRFGIRGNYSSGSVRGTTWTVSDRCDGTLTAVTRGRVAVRDFRRRKTIMVRVGKRYLARAPR